MNSWLAGLRCFVVIGFVCSASTFCGNLSAPFLNLVENGSLQQITNLLEHQYGDIGGVAPEACVQDLINAVDQDGKTSLHYAVKSGCQDKVFLLLRLCIQLLNQVDNAGKSPLVDAVEVNSLLMTQFLLQHGARVNRGTQMGETPFSIVSRLQKANGGKKNNAIAELLGKYEAPCQPIPDELWDLGARDDSYTSSSDDSSEYDLGSSFQEGLPRSLSYSARLSDLGQSPKRFHRSPGCDFIQVSVALPITPVMSRNPSFTMLQEAAALKSIASKILVDKKQHSLQQALLDGRYKDASKMVLTGQRALKPSHIILLNKVDNKLGCSPLLHAVFVQDYQMVESLISLGASIDQADSLGRTPRKVAFGLHTCSGSAQKINQLFEQLDCFDFEKKGLLESLLTENYQQAFLLVQDNPASWNQCYATMLNAPDDDGTTRLGRAIKAVNHDDMRCLVCLGAKATDIELGLAGECGVLGPLLQYMRLKKVIHQGGEELVKSEVLILNLSQKTVSVCSEEKSEVSNQKAGLLFEV